MVEGVGWIGDVSLVLKGDDTRAGRKVDEIVFVIRRSARGEFCREGEDG